MSLIRNLMEQVLDYSRVYASFIASRKAMRHKSDACVERHHIVPRCLGGDDHPSNLIDLTPEDHFFAHLLLARIHGGKLWRPICMMAAVACRQELSARVMKRARRAYGKARRLMSREGNNKFNATVFDWVNLDTGQRRSSVIYDMHREFGGNRAAWTSVVSGAKQSILGWALANRGVRIRGFKGKTFRFVNRDGRTFEGTQAEFCAAQGLSGATASRIVRSSSVSACGWRLVGTADRPHTSPKSGEPSGPKPQLIRLVNGDQVIEGTRREIANALGTTPGSVSACVYMMRKGTLAAFKGYALQ